MKTTRDRAKAMKKLKKGQETSKQLAVGYMRTSAAVGAGTDSDSEKRQHLAISSYAAKADYELVKCWYDCGVSGVDEVIGRAAFNEMLAYVTENGIKTVIIESADRLARDLMIQMLAHDLLKKRGITLIAANAPEWFLEETNTAILVRQIMGSIYEFERKQIIAKLTAARARIRAIEGQCGGRLRIEKADPAAVAIAKKLKNERKRCWSLRAIAAHLAGQGFTSKSGKDYAPSTIKAMLKCG
jgi:DNA invertase Pin-like site-specific DNA recombinase